MPPGFTVKLGGVAEIEKSGGGATFSVAEFELCEREPLVPPTVKLVLPRAIAEVVVMVSVDVIPGVIADGLKEPVAPEGKLFAERVMDPVKPFKAEALTVYVAVPPGLTVTLEGVTDTEKSGGAVTVRVTGAVPCEREPLVPVTVTAELPTGVVP